MDQLNLMEKVTEIEEHMTDKYRPLYNSKGKRGSKLHGPNGRPEIES